MASTAMPGFGIKLYYGTSTSASTSGAAVAQIKDVSGPSIAANDIDITNNDSPNGYKEFLPGLKDGGDVSFDLVFNGNSSPHALVGNTNTFTIHIPGASTATTDDRMLYFGGYWKSGGFELPMDGAVTVKMTIKVSGPITVS